MIVWERILGGNFSAGPREERVPMGGQWKIIEKGTGFLTVQNLGESSGATRKTGLETERKKYGSLTER